ncbi:chaplin [Streptomyces sp. URMC 126]|uniref:chaplin n=1 Tax=Streptomyces sp. URMC 126 TaxID=3423401 RepID=UPI003F1B57C9
MRRTSIGLAVCACVLVCDGPASADAGGHGAAVRSPGVLTGDLVQIPVHAPMNKCGDTGNLVGLLNPTSGGVCDIGSGGHGHASGGAVSRGAAVGSPGVVSGDTVQAPISIPVNFCNATGNLVGLLNPTSGGVCATD